MSSLNKRQVVEKTVETQVGILLDILVNAMMRHKCDGVDLTWHNVSTWIDAWDPDTPKRDWEYHATGKHFELRMDT